MNIIVCVKQVPDPEIPLAKFRIDPDLRCPRGRMIL